MPHSSFGEPCKAKTKTVRSEGWSFDTPRNPTTGGRRDTVSLAVDERIASIVAYLMKSSDEGGYKNRNGATWGYVCRKIRGGTSMSNHSWALAIDLNSDRNGMWKRKSADLFDPAITDMPPWLVLLWEAWGFRWGGKYGTTYNGKSGSGVQGFPAGLTGIVGRTTDAMHFEFMGSTTDAKNLSQAAGLHFLAGNFGVGPDGKKIAPGSGGGTTKEAVEAQMAIGTVDTYQLTKDLYQERYGKLGDGKGMAHNAMRIASRSEDVAAMRSAIDGVRKALGLKPWWA